MQKKVSMKVPNGKMLRVMAEIENSIIISAQITGDFFVYPEENIAHLEQLLRYQPLEKELLLYMIDSFFKQNNVELYGVTAEAICDALLLCGEDDEGKNG